MQPRIFAHVDIMPYLTCTLSKGTVDNLGRISAQLCVIFFFHFATNDLLTGQGGAMTDKMRENIYDLLDTQELREMINNLNIDILSRLSNSNSIVLVFIIM